MSKDKVSKGTVRSNKGDKSILEHSLKITKTKPASSYQKTSAKSTQKK